MLVSLLDLLFWVSPHYILEKGVLICEQTREKSMAKPMSSVRLGRVSVSITRGNGKMEKTRKILPKPVGARTTGSEQLIKDAGITMLMR
jgi:hypothetical protein